MRSRGPLRDLEVEVEILESLVACIGDESSHASTLRALVGHPTGASSRRAGLPTNAEVEAALSELLGRLERLDPTVRLLIPQRVIEATFTDLGLTYHAVYRGGQIEGPHVGAAPRADIRLTGDSADLLSLANGEMTFSKAYSGGHVTIEAGISDLLLLRSLL